MEVLVLPNLLKRTLLVLLVTMVTAGQAFAQIVTTREVTTSQLSQGVGATGDAAATAGSTGSLSAKLRLMTTQLNTLLSTGVNVTNLPTAANTSALAVRCVNTAGNAFEACGGSSSSTQYADGATQATPTGNVMLWLDTSNVLRAPSATRPLPVNIISSSVGSTSTDDDGALPSGTTGMTEVIDRMYAHNSDSASGVYTRWTHQPLDFDSGAGTENLSVIGIGLPASGGPVIGGTSSNPFNVVFPSAQAITVASLPLPTGAATEATLANLLTTTNFNAAFGTAGSADSQVMSVQGIASMTPLQVQSNSANIATQTTLADILTALQLIDNDQTGASLHHRISVGTTEDEHEVKGSAGRLFAINVTNTNAAVRYLRCANQVIGSTTPGTTTVFYGMAIPAATTGAGYTASFGPKGIAFSTGLTCWLVTGAAETDVTEVAANEINVNYVYE
jgi:hypothetical protein